MAKKFRVAFAGVYRSLQTTPGGHNWGSAFAPVEDVQIVAAYDAGQETSAPTGIGQLSTPCEVTIANGSIPPNDGFFAGWRLGSRSVSCQSRKRRDMDKALVRRNGGIQTGWPG
jgi:hypothetical protein